MENRNSLLGSWTLVVGFWLLGHGRLLMGELYWGDAGIYFYPSWEFVRRCLQRGELPFWNPHINGGQPLIGNPQMGIFYPTTLLLLWLPTERWLSLVTALHLLWSGVGMWLWLRALHRSPQASAWGACAWMGCTAVVARAQFPPFLMSIAWYPWVLWSVERVWQQPCLPRALWLALIGALCTMAAHPQGVYLIACAAGLYGIVRMWQGPLTHTLSPAGRGFSPSPIPPPSQARERTVARQEARRQLLWLVGAAMLALALSAIYWLPASAVGALSSYSHMSIEEAERFRWNILHLGALFYPFLWGNPAVLYVARGNYWEVTAYIGTLPLLLVPFALGRGMQARLRWGLGLIALLTAWLALGTQGGLYTLAFNLLPGMRMFHDPARWLLMTCLMTAALSAFGYDQLQNTQTRCPEAKNGRSEGTPVSSARAVRLAPFAVGLLICLLMAGLPATRIGTEWQRAFLTPRAREDYPRPSERQMLQVAQRGWRQGALWLGASLGLLALAKALPRRRTLCLWLGFVPMQLYAVYCSLPVAPPGSWAQAKRLMHAPDGRWWYPQTYDGWRRFISYLTYADASPQQMVQAWIPNLPMLLPATLWGAYEPLAPQRVSRMEQVIRFARPDRRARWLRALGVEWRATLENDEARFKRLAPPCEPVQFVLDAVPVRNFDEMLHRFRREPADPCQRALVEGLPRAVRSPGGRIQLLKRSNAQLYLRVKCPQETVLIVRETLLPGWRAWIDGKAVPLRYADGVNRALQVPAGQHEVILRYRPPRWAAGVWISLLSLSAWLLGWLICARRTGTQQEMPAV